MSGKFAIARMCFHLNATYVRDFYRFEVVDRGSETQF